MIFPYAKGLWHLVSLPAAGSLKSIFCVVQSKGKIKVLNCLALSRISAPRDFCIKRWKFQLLEPRNTQKCMALLHFISFSYKQHWKCQKIIYYFIIYKEYLFFSCNFFDAWLWGRGRKWNKASAVQGCSLSGCTTTCI